MHYSFGNQKGGRPWPSKLLCDCHGPVLFLIAITVYLYHKDLLHFTEATLIIVVYITQNAHQNQGFDNCQPKRNP